MGKFFTTILLKALIQASREIATFENDVTIFNRSHLAACDGIRSSIRETVFYSQIKSHDTVATAHGEVMGKSRASIYVHFALGPNSHIVNYPVNNEGDVSFVGCQRAK